MNFLLIYGHAFGFIRPMYLVLALLKVALVNFTLNEYMI